MTEPLTEQEVREFIAILEAGEHPITPGGWLRALAEDWLRLREQRDVLRVALADWQERLAYWEMERARPAEARVALLTDEAEVLRRKLTAAQTASTRTLTRSDAGLAATEEQRDEWQNEAEQRSEWARVHLNAAEAKVARLTEALEAANRFIRDGGTRNFDTWQAAVAVAEEPAEPEPRKRKRRSYRSGDTYR